MVTSKLVRIANQASSQDIAAAGGIPSTVTLREQTYRVRVSHAPSLEAHEQKLIWSLWDANMRAMTEPSSFGWDPRKKKKELFHRNARFILLYACESDPQNEEASTPIAAFSTFRFERDQGEDVLYCYELQVADDFRGSGLGRFLIDSLTAIGQHYHMEKIMLTVLKCNEAARLFYARTGFTMDPSSPDYRSTSQDDGLRGVEKHFEESCDYEILAKALL